MHPRVIELESKLASLSVNSASCDKKLVDLTLSNKNLADKLATLYSDMSEMKVRLARLHSVNVQLDTVVSKLNSRLDNELTSSSAIGSWLHWVLSVFRLLITSKFSIQKFFLVRVPEMIPGYPGSSISIGDDLMSCFG